MTKHLYFRNYIFNKKELRNVLSETFLDFGLNQAGYLSNNIKELGFYYSTQAGISISLEDLKVTPKKPYELQRAYNQLGQANIAFKRGEISPIERFQQLIHTWNNTSEILRKRLISYFLKTDPLNSIYLMAFSGARGNISQVRQLVGMRGLMSDPNGQIIDIPIVHNFREGLTVTDYIMSSYGARKGVVDTALKTADSGYLTRRLVDVAQDVVISEYDCQTQGYVTLRRFKLNDLNFQNQLLGRTLAREISDISWQFNTQKLINRPLAQYELKKLFQTEFKQIKVRSPLTCQSSRSVCQLCYGWNLASSSLVQLGEAVGIIAAQSIGEPGTQLTMRTFHTGGIFTADPSRQIRSSIAGFIKFETPLFKFKHRRTIYGAKFLLLEQALKLEIRNYKNKTSYLMLEPQTKLFITEGSFVNVDFLLAELPILSQQTTLVKTPFLSPLMGELRQPNNDNVIWILAGSVFDLPFLSLTNLIKNLSVLDQFDGLAKVKLTSKDFGYLVLNSSNSLLLAKNYFAYSIFNLISLCNAPIFYDQDEAAFYCINLSRSLYRFVLNNGQFLNSFESVIATRIDSECILPTGGSRFFVSLKRMFFDKNLKKSVYSNSNLDLRTFVYVAEETHVVNKPATQLRFDNCTFFRQTNLNVVSGFQTRVPGFFTYKEMVRNHVKFISIKPGQVYEYLYKKLPLDELTYLFFLDSKLVFPGEILLDEIVVHELSYVEIILFEQQIFILLRPALEYNVYFGLCSNVLLKQSNVLEKIIPTVSFESNHHLTYTPLNLIKHQLVLKSRLPLNFVFLRFSPNIIIPSFITLKIFKFSSFFSNTRLANKQITFLPVLKEFSFIEPHMLLGTLIVRKFGKNLIEPNLVKFQFNNVFKLLIIPRLVYQHYDFLSALNIRFKSSSFLRFKDFLTNNLISSISGYLTSSTPFSCYIHYASPLFLTGGIQLSSTSGDFVFKRQQLGILRYEKIVTGDIVQGLPKVEEIFEARSPRISSKLSLFPGILIMRSPIVSANVTRLTFVSPHQYLKFPLLSQLVLFNDKFLEVDLILNDFINLGQPLSTGSINPHLLLQVFFDYYRLRLKEEIAALVSFKYLQFLLVTKVQQVYSSQGVTIADKHLEVIVRQITCKVEIIATGSTLLLEQEILDLNQITYINTALMRRNKFKPQFKPILIGITRTSLLTDSFISAASFQETTKVLTTAAIEGKIDWLRGLKENVILGRLIPVGQGFMVQNNPNVQKLRLVLN